MSLFQEGYKLYERQMVSRLCINIGMCYLSQLFPLFCPFRCMFSVLQVAYDAVFLIPFLEGVS
jgi:hypothetical protein